MADDVERMTGGPGRGRRSRRHGPRVSGSDRGGAAGGIVPAAQGPYTIAHRPVATHSLMPYLVEVGHLVTAARLCMRRASAPGADGVSWAAYRRGLRERLSDLADRLRNGVWRPGPLREVGIRSYTGKVFAAVVPTVEDRIVHRAMRVAVDPVLEAALPDWVSGYRPARSRIYEHG